VQHPANFLGIRNQCCGFRLAHDANALTDF